MSALDLIERLRKAGVRLSVSNGKIKLKAGKGSLTDELKQEIVANKQEIISLLGSDSDDQPELVSVSRDGPLPFAYAQQRLWFLAELEPGTLVYNMPFSLRVRGNLNTEALDKAVADLISKHESLRTVFVASDASKNASTNNEPQQIILDSIDVVVNYEDLQQQDEAAVKALAAMAAVESSQQANQALLTAHQQAQDCSAAALQALELSDTTAAETQQLQQQLTKMRNLVEQL